MSWPKMMDVVFGFVTFCFGALLLAVAYRVIFTPEFFSQS